MRDGVDISLAEKTGGQDPIVQAAEYGSHKRIPDFFIVGHPKCGTTALYEMLRCHPQIYMPGIKEPNFFNFSAVERDYSSEQRFVVDPPQAFDDYLSLFKTAKPQQRVGEASAFYLSSRSAPRGIAAMQPDAYIIAILREPASFLRSLHFQLVQSDVETETDLRSALSLEDARREGRHVPEYSSKWQKWLLYSDHVRYVNQLRRYYALFPPEHLMVLIYDDFRHDNEGTLRSVLRFLGVDDSFPVNMTEANTTVRVRSQRLHHMVYAVTMGRGAVATRINKVIRMLTSRQLRHLTLKVTQHRLLYSDPRPPDERLMMELRERFKPEVVALSEYLDRDLVTLWGYDAVG
jgi:hypothetical protein